ncbi:MAG: ABC transporter ATP-binding protein [Proteobacteria bacterium]|nr:ABC transporter ATP-binding protein [Pseudomonadota bacterium]
MKRDDETSALDVAGLTKRFGSYTAVDEVSFSVGRGEIFGFLGPNGAGKTTTIKMLAGLLKPDGGAITICDHQMATDPTACKKLTAYIPDRPYLYEKLTGYEFLQFVASLYSLSREQFGSIEQYLQLFDLLDWQHHLIECYSHGMKQKIIMTAAFMLDCPLIIVDEPMVGLDPKSARIVKELLKNHARKGNSIFLSTHSLEIAEELCDRIGIIVHGELRSLGTLESLRREAQLDNSDLEEIFLELTGADELTAIISALKGDNG